MRFNRDAGTIADRRVASRKARGHDEPINPFRQITVIAEGHVLRQQVAGAFCRRKYSLIESIAHPGQHRRSHMLVMLVDVRDVVLEIRAVRDVTINQQIGTPLCPQLQPCASFGRIGFHVIPVEIEIGRGGAPAHLSGAVLVDAIERAESLVSVRVVNWNEEDDDPVEQSRSSFSNRDVTQQGESGIFAVGFSGVDASLNHNYRLACFSCCLRCKGFAARRDEKRKRAPFPALTETLEAKQGRSSGQFPRIGNGFLIARRLAVTCLFGERLPFGGYRRRRALSHNHLLRPQRGKQQ